MFVDGAEILCFLCRRSQGTFRIDGEETSVEEFEHYYTQVYAVSRVSVERFLPHFLYYKLKVADAKRQSWDTITDFRLQCSALQMKF